MMGLSRLVLILGLLLSWTTTSIASNTETRATNCNDGDCSKKYRRLARPKQILKSLNEKQDEAKSPKISTRELYHRGGYLSGTFPAERRRKSGHYRGKGGKGLSKSKSRKGKGKGKGKGGGGRHYYYEDDDYYHYQRPGYYFDDPLDTGDYDVDYYNVDYCVPYRSSRFSSSSSSSSSSDSYDWHRDRRLRGKDENQNKRGGKHPEQDSERRLKRKGKGGKGGKGGYYSRYGHDYAGGGQSPLYGPEDFLGEGYGYGYEYAPDGYLRPRCPPGYVYYDQLPASSRPDRPGLDSPSLSDDLFLPTEMPSEAPTPAGGPPATPGPDTPAPDTPAPDTPAPDTPAPDTPAPDTPAPDTPAPDTPAPDTPAPDTPAPDTPAPSTAPDTSAPTATQTANEEAGTVRIEDSFIEYGFFDTITARAPTQEEIDGVVEQTILFFTDVFSNRYGADFESFNTDNIMFSFSDPDAEYPVRFDFDAVVMFVEGSDPPSRDEVFQTMQDSDLNNYIQAYVWNGSPGMSGLFYDTQRVRYDAFIQGRQR